MELEIVGWKPERSEQTLCLCGSQGRVQSLQPVPRFCGAGLGPACASHRQLREQVDDVHQQWVGGQAC